MLIALIVITAALYPELALTQTLDQPIRFAILGDRTGGHEPGVYVGIVEEIERLKPDFVITVGDMIEGYVDDSARIDNEWDEYLSIVSQLSMPIYFTVGNHDIWSEMSARFYESYIGDPYYSFDVGDVHFAIVDNSLGEVTGDIHEEQLDWLRNDLASNSNRAYTFVFMHKPFWFNSTADGNPDIMHDIFLENGVDAVITGHFHKYFSGEYDGIRYIGIGSSGGGVDEGAVELKYHYAWVTVDNNGVHVAPIEAGAVKSWDVMTVDESKFINQIKYRGVKISKSLAINENFEVESPVFAIEITNMHADMPIVDTISWHLPSGWSATPEIATVELKPDETKSIEFELTNASDLFPLPTFTVAYPYSENGYYHYSSSILFARTVYCDRIRGEIVVDGDLSEYAGLVPAESFFSPHGGRAVIDPVAFYFAWDADAVYLAARCTDQFIDSVQAVVEEHDGAIYGEDCVGYFIQPDRGNEEAYQIYINPLGTVFDQFIYANEDGYPLGDRNWNGSYSVATMKEIGQWTVEARIPLDQWNVSPAVGDEWGINFRRKQPRLESSADWIVPIDYDPSTFGRLVFR